jgi:hypothetical protein
MEDNKLHIFISWSKPHAKIIAEALWRLLKELFPEQVEVFFSNDYYDGVKSGENADQKIDSKIRQCKLGFLILTKNNFGEPWLMYEAGGLAISTHKNIIPFIVDREEKEIERPIDRVVNYVKYDKDKFYERIVCPVWEKIYDKSMTKGSNEENLLKDKLLDLNRDTGKSKLDIFHETIECLLKSRDYKIDVMQYKMQEKGTYYTRDEHLINLITELGSNKSERIIIIGTPSKILNNTQMFIDWANKNSSSKLFICPETYELLLERRKIEITKENQWNAENHVAKKIEAINGMRNKMKDLTNVYFVDINRKFSNYVTIDGSYIYVTPVFNKRSSETFTLLFTDKEKKEDIIDYVKSKIDESISGATNLMDELDLMKNEIKHSK